MISLAFVLLVADYSMGASVNEATDVCRMIPQADESRSIELCASDQQWKSIVGKVGGNIENLRCIFIDSSSSGEPVRACGTKEQLMKKTGATRVQDISDVQCKKVTEAGSRIPRKVCLTKNQWKEMKRETAGQVESDLRNRTGN